MKQGAGRDQVANIEHALGQRVGVHAGVNPAEQAGRFGGERAAVAQGQLHTAVAGLAQSGADAFSVAAQLALVNAVGQRFFQQCRGGQCGQQFGVQQAFDQMRRSSHEPHAPAGRQDFGETAHINRALQAVQRAQPGGVFRRKVAVGVVFNDVKVVLLGQLQHAVGAARADGRACGVVQHADADKQLGRIRLAVARHHSQVGAIGVARHRQDLHAQRPQARKLHSPAGFFHHHTVAGLQQRAADDVQRVRGPHGGDDLLGRHREVEGAQLVRQRAAQADVALGFAILQGPVGQRLGTRELAHGSRQERRHQPVRREHAHAGLRLHGSSAALPGSHQRLVEHAANQLRGVNRGRHCAHRQWVICYYFSSITGSSNLDYRHI